MKFKVTRNIIVPGAMKRNNLVLVLIAVFFFIISYTSCYQILLDSPATDTLKNNDVRAKRELEDLENDDEFALPSSPGMEEEPGFWDRVVKIAMKIFNKFIEWLNS
ncbi:hypothetical protein KGM_215561 [Danaus plexippus plexippus]|uniref:Uncharacterized protein n=1 Tax=Danaus plexippus plexippus TaxID=278856 RepID=A0A212EVA9_DANPL|nr:hypothetical protein KGM_215561 [Danaus plexippus plexippus]